MSSIVRDWCKGGDVVWGNALGIRVAGGGPRGSLGVDGGGHEGDPNDNLTTNLG